MKTYARKKRACVELDNVEQLCRLCLEKVEEGVTIFNNVQDVCSALAVRIMSCVGLEMQQDSLLPNKICKPCNEKLEKYYKFRKKCEDSYQKLKHHLMAVKEKQKQNVKKHGMLQTLSVESVEERQIDVETVDEEQRQIDVQIIDEEERDEEKKLVIQTEEPDAVENYVDKPIEIEQVSLQPDVEPDISTFLSGVLLELGVLQQQSGLQLQGVSTFQLETGSGEQLVMALVEEDEEVEDLKPDINVEIKQPLSLLSERVTNLNADATPEKKCSRLWCNICARSFSSRSAATRHARAHSGVRPYVCATCGARFKQNSVLQRHMLVHLEVRPHRCTECKASFTQRGGLAAHMRTHAAPAHRNLRLHECTLCDKVFLYASGLSRHMSQHTGRLYSCTECGKTFKDQSSLHRHRRNFFHGHKHVQGVASKIAVVNIPSKRLTSSNKHIKRTKHIVNEVTEIIERENSHHIDGDTEINMAAETVSGELSQGHKNDQSIDMDTKNISTEKIHTNNITDNNFTTFRWNSSAS